MLIRLLYPEPSRGLQALEATLLGWGLGPGAIHCFDLGLAARCCCAGGLRGAAVDGIGAAAGCEGAGPGGAVPSSQHLVIDKSNRYSHSSKLDTVYKSIH